MVGAGGGSADEVEEARQRDRELFERLIDAGFEGPVWAATADAMARYCCGVVEAWLRRGDMFRRCDLRGYRLAHPSLPLTQQEISDLTADTVTAALNTFRNRSRDGHGWRPDGGASIATWIVEDCIAAFPGVWRRWLGQQRRQRRLQERTEALETLQELHIGRLQNATATEDTVVLRDKVVRLLEAVDPELRKALEFMAMGYTQAAACELVGGKLTPRALEGRLYRLRQRLQVEGDA